jgi:tetratricopeptide (TPR) repeat protein
MLAAGLCAAATCGWVRPGRAQEPGGTGLPPGAPPLENPPFKVERPPYDPTAAGKVVAFWEGAAAKNPRGALELRELAGAYLARQREAGDIADAVRAEAAARRSLEILPRRNAAAIGRLASSLLAQHRFPEAMEQARRAAALDPDYTRLVVDIDLELGEYDAARRELAATPPRSDDLNARMLRARLDALDGKPEEALRLMREARDLSDRIYDMPHEVAAWYHTMIGHALIDSGRLAEGEAACKEALAIFPRDYRAMTGLAEAAAWRKDWAAALDWAGEAVAIAPQNPEALRLLGDAHKERGDAAAAEREFRRLKELAHSFPRIYDRHWVLFCADEGRDLDEALALARKDLGLRHDAGAYDTLAWACLKKGLLDEADAMSKKALAHGAADPVIRRHAAEVARARGDAAAAEAHLAKARALNPSLAK